MGAWPVCPTVHVLFVWLATGASVLVKDFARPSLRLQQHRELLYPDNPTWRTETQRPGGIFDQPCSLPNWILDDYTVCGDGYCRCRGKVADCSGHSGHLTYVPRLPPGILQVVFTHNELLAISRDDFFSNITHVMDLDLVTS
ncbi:hypothetical protein BaRGS_00021141 [Batillaria attramentaria]|uniref:Uncharacterized protein n=1 Tax=Batillaria attramentaria TaxID=370345 RepID=A0ABD0KKG2_9CAEN